MTEDLATLTDKEKETLRLILRGHDAKSSARELGLSVHTINGRLRDARRKLGVTSSKEAARLLLAKEGGEKLAGKDLGDAGGNEGAHQDAASRAGPVSARAIAGASIMTIIIAAAALAIFAPAAHDPATETSKIATQESAAQVAAREWLELVDARDWQASYAATATAFREANTMEVWSETAGSVQGELGATLSRTVLTEDDVPSPQGLRIVKFRTDFANREGVIETVSLVREGGAWTVAGIYVS